MHIRPGRPAGGRTDAKERIRESAARRFVEYGYAGTTLRSVAADCHVDVALISYYYGSKRGLFSAAMQLPISPDQVLRASLSVGPLDAGNLLASVIGIWEDPRTGVPLQALARRALAHDSDQVALRQYLEAELIPTLSRQLAGPARERRARAAIYVLAGAVLGHYVLGLNTGGGPQRLFADLITPLRAALEDPARR